MFSYNVPESDAFITIMNNDRFFAWQSNEIIILMADVLNLWLTGQFTTNCF